MANPATLFWGAGVALHGYSVGGFTTLLEVVQGSSLAVLLLMAAGVLMVISASSAAVDVTLPYVLRWLEGYWPNRIGRLRDWKAAKARTRFRRKRDRWRELARRHAVLDHAEHAEYRSLDEQLLSYPDHPSLVLPTRLGNVLRAAESYSMRRYGLAAVIMWPRVWFATPDHVRDELTAARRSLDSSLRGFVWSLLFTVWLGFSWWVLPVAFSGCLLAHLRMLATSATYAELVKATFDVYHRDVFLQLGWISSRSDVLELPTEGERLSVFIRRGPDAL